ncbi:hypothetical protein ACTFIU_004558 [Dictyostelium citrinum]
MDPLVNIKNEIAIMNHKISAFATYVNSQLLEFKQNMSNIELMLQESIESKKKTRTYTKKPKTDTESNSPLPPSISTIAAIATCSSITSTHTSPPIINVQLSNSPSILTPTSRKKLSLVDIDKNNSGNNNTTNNNNSNNNNKKNGTTDNDKKEREKKQKEDKESENRQISQALNELKKKLEFDEKEKLERQNLEKQRLEKEKETLEKEDDKILEKEDYEILEKEDENVENNNENEEQTTKIKRGRKKVTKETVEIDSSKRPVRNKTLTPLGIALAKENENSPKKRQRK